MVLFRFGAFDIDVYIAHLIMGNLRASKWIAVMDRGRDELRAENTETEREAKRAFRIWNNNKYFNTTRGWWFVGLLAGWLTDWLHGYGV